MLSIDAQKCTYRRVPESACKVILLSLAFKEGLQTVSYSIHFEPPINEAHSNHGIEPSPNGKANDETLFKL